MKKAFIIFSVVSLSWCFALGFLVYKDMFGPNVFWPEVSFISRELLNKKTTTTILAFGDMMLDRAVRGKINQNGAEYPFALIKDFIAGNDVVVANAEGPFTDFASVTLDRKNAPLRFTFDPATLPMLKKLGFTLLSQANNHTLNFGAQGLAQSRSYIGAAGLHYFGDPNNIDVGPYVVEVKGEKIGFIGYHEFAYKGLENVLRAIRESKKELSYIVVYPHWGQEYKVNFTSSQQKIAHAFIDAGADAVIGAHPHVIEPIEIYKNKIIFYSLGNFIFDQSNTGPTSRGLSVKILLKKDLVTYKLFPIKIEHQQASLMDAEESQKELDVLGFASGKIELVR